MFLRSQPEIINRVVVTVNADLCFSRPYLDSNLSSNGVHDHSEIKLEESVFVSRPMTIVSQNIDFISTSDISTILPSKLVNDNKPLFSLSNSSLSFTNVAFTIADQIIATVDETSHFKSESCLLESNGRKLFEVDGTLILVQTTLVQPTTTSSLIVSLSTNGEFRLFACRLEQTHKIASSPILGDSLRTIQLCHCQIRNVTHSPVLSSLEAQHTSQTSSLIVGNSFMSNEDVLDGNVGNKADFIDSCRISRVLNVALHNTVFMDGKVTRYEGSWKSDDCYGTFESSSCMLSHCTGTTNGQFGFRSQKGTISLQFWKIVGNSGNIGPAIDNEILHTGQTLLADLSLKDCWFEAGDGGKGGLDVSVFKDLNSMNKDKVVNCFSTNQPKSVIHFDGTENVQSQFLTVLDIIIDSTDGVDEAFCWVPGNGNGCKTLTDTLPRLSVLFEGKLLLKCEENSESVEMEESDLTIGERHLDVEGDGKDKVRIADKSTSVLFSITTGSLALSSVSLVPSPTSTLVEVSNGGTFELSDVIVDGAAQTDAAFTKPFFVGTTGSLIFYSVKLSGFIFQDAAPIRITNEGQTLLTIQSSNFTSITRQEGSGVVVEASLSTNSEVTIKSCQFVDCHSLDKDYTGFEITDPKISNPSAQTRGGIVRVIGNAAKPGSIEITDTHFASNSIAGGSGAGLYLNQIGSASITSCHFESLTADGIEIRGAALTSLGVITTTITSCDFLKCKISKNLYAAYSGAISVVQGQVIARDCNIAECSSAHMINAVFFNNISTGSSVENVVLRNCVGGHDIFFFVWSSSGLTLSNIHFIDCGIEEKEWAPLSFGFKSPNLASVDGLFVASSSSSLQKGRITINPIWLSETSSLSFSNCQLLCDEPFITEENDFSSGFLTPQLRVAAESDPPTAIDETMCAHPSRLCRTVAFALKLCPTVLSTSDPVLVEIGEGEHEEDPLVIAKKIKLISLDVAKHALLKTKDSTGSLLTVKQNGILIVESLSIVLTPVDSGKATISSSGTLTLTAITFVNPSSSPTISGHLVEIAEGSGTISKCVIPACRLSQGTSIIQIQSGTSVNLMEQEVNLNHSELGTFLNIVGTASIESSSFSNITSLSSLITGNGSLTILDSSFFSIREKDMSPFPNRAIDIPVGYDQILAIGADSKPVFFTSCSSRGDGGALHCSISGSGILSISHTTFTDCSSSKEGGACFVDLLLLSSGSFNVDASVFFSDCQAKDDHMNGIFIVCSDIAALILPLAESTLLAAVKPTFTSNSVFTTEERDRLSGRETKMGGTEGSLLFYWHPHRTGAVHLSSGGEDHPLCGVTELPFSIDSDLNLTSPLLSTVTNWILRGSPSNSLNVYNDAQIIIQTGVSSSLTLASLSIQFETDVASRVLPVFDIQSGSLEMDGCTLTTNSDSLACILFLMRGGSVIIDSSSSVLAPCGIVPVVSVDGGWFSIENEQFEHIALSSSLIGGSGSVLILDCNFTSLVDSTTSSSNSEGARALTLSIGNSQKVEIGAESKPVLFTSCSSRGDGGALHCTLSEGGVLAISHTSFTECSSSKEGGGCFVDLSAISTGSFRTGEGVSFTDCEVEDGNGNGLFVVCSDLQAFLTPTSDPSPLASIKPNVSPNSVFTDEQRKLLWGRETKVGGSEGSLLFYWHPHRTGAVHLRTGGEDHPLCGVTELPCSTLSQAMRNLKPQSPESETPEIDIDSDLNLTSPLLSTVTKWILRGSASNSLTVYNDAQISIQNGVPSSLTLASLSMQFEINSANRMMPILDVQSGAIEMTDCSINSDQKSIASSLFAVGGGSLILTKGSIATPSSSHPLLSITSGSFSIDTEDVIVSVQPTRSSPLISMSGGTSSISGPITSLMSSHAAFSLSGTAILKFKSNSDFSNGSVGSVVTMDGGKIEMESSTFEKASLSSSLISGSGSVSIADSSFTSLEESTTSSSNSEGVRTLTVSVGNNQKVEIGGDSKPVLFTSCSSRGEGGALQCSISGSGILAISHTTFDECFSQQFGGGLAIVCEDGIVSSSLSVQVTFTSCSSAVRSTNALHLTAFSFESLIDSSRWIINENSLKSPDNNAVLWGEDLAEESESKYRSLTLLYYLFPYRHSEISTSVEGRDGEGCGQPTLPCSSLSTAHSHLVGDHTLTLVVMGKTRLDETVSLSKQNLLIEPQGGVGVIVVSSNGQLLNIHPSSTSHTVTITHISFDLSSAQAQSLIWSNNGEISLTSCSITSSASISAKLISVSAGTLQITNLNLTGLSFSSIPFELSTSATGSFFNLTDTSTTTDQLLSASNSTVYLSQCKLSGAKEISQTNEEEICGWSTGFVSLDNCTTTLTGSSFSHFGNGAIAMKDGKLEIDSSSFKENNPHLSDFPSLHRNIVCVGNGLIEISTLSGGDGSTDKLPSGWMKMEDDCSVLSDLVEPYEVFFIPSITKNVVGYDKKTKLFDLKIEGELLIPCGLSLEVFEVLNGTRQNSTEVDPLTLSAKNWTESSFSITLNETTLLNSLKTEPEWHARLLFGVDGTTTSFKLKESLAEIKKAQTTRTMKWLLPVIIGVSVVLILILLIVLLLWCRQHRKKNTPLASQAELNDLPEVMDEKMEMADENTVGTTAFVFDKPADAKSESFVPLNAFGQPGPISDELPSDVAVIQGMMMDGREETVQINRHDTLFNRLHRPSRHHQNHSIDKKSVEAQIAAGLVQFDVFNLAAFLSNFSPHSIIVQDNNAVIFNLSHDEKHGTTLNDGKTGNDAQRWQAPELAGNENENEDQKNTDARHGAVFSLGLVLWEIETELVPFRELDAANAQRALATGTGLDLSLVSDEALRGKIEECLSLHADKRPKLSDLSSFLDSRSNNPKPPEASDKKQNVQLASKI
ncbi:hypothetical protein BLNAU_21323 [Blattamonas nauphoetae]|uniref:Serine-threonine/tyrosine-protein kinase catalytic domain-containing protein n=1 Tax=Blattamonas nauphoetae TaxID=2049346 RepID=A0ABQ9WWR5_9EUKA|nr:hypothetical protein BLNAU_21323 [Blattamonas nauphoetae]